MKKRTYTIQFARSAGKDLDDLPRRLQARVLAAIMDLGEDPRPRGCDKIIGWDDAYRIRVGVYRVVYIVEQKKLLIVVIRFGHRKDVYRGL